jgi:hypothetical protein
MPARDDAMNIAQALADLEVEYDIPMNNPLHAALLTGLNNNSDALALTADDLDDIKGVGSATPAKPSAAQPRDGTGKD